MFFFLTKKKGGKMIEYIILEKDDIVKKQYQEIIDKVMMNYDYEYKKKEINNKNQDKIINTDTFKIYILNQNEGINLSKKIRLEKDDWTSLIIFIGSNLEQVIKERLFILDYIYKDENLNILLERALHIALKTYDKRPNKLNYTYKKIIYNIDYYKILYIEKEQNNKRCIIKTKDNLYYIQTTLSSLEKLLDNRFIRCSKSHIINIDQVDYYDTIDNLIVLTNKEIIYSISKKEKKKIIDSLRHC